MDKATLRRLVVLTGVLSVILASGPARAATVIQSVPLLAGWNAVFLEVEPANQDPAAVLAGVAGLESVWAWNRNTSTVQFVQDPGLPVEPPPYMLAYVPGNPLITNLHAIRGETAYLVKIATGTSPQSWNVSGQPAVPKADWKPNSFNLVGFHLDRSLAPGALPTYFDFFAASPAHYLTPPLPDLPGPEIYRLDNASGTWKRAVSTDKMQPGEAFWVYSQGSSTFAGPLAVQLEQGNGLDFGAVLDQQVVVIRNDGSGPGPRTVTVRAVSGTAQLYHGQWVEQAPPATPAWRHEWRNLLTSHPALAIAAGGQHRLRVGAVRAGLASGGTFEDNVEIRDGVGMSILLPAKVRGMSTAGLWVGSVVVDKVRDNGSGSPDATAVGSPFAFRVIVHVSDDATPQVRLLRDVVQLWREGTWKADPDNVGHLVVDQPGQFVLVANPLRLGEFRGAALRDGQEVGRRISTAAFGFATPQPKSGGSFAPGSTLGFDLTLAPNDPTNPFVHQYHKDHSAKDSYEVQRLPAFEFLLDDPAGSSLAGVPFLGWGSSEVGGRYSETIRLRRANPADPSQPDPGDASYGVEVRGTFRLRRVSDVGQLQL
ncbi:MAG TPA: hypothetical protein VI078_15935 [bacterium]